MGERYWLSRGGFLFRGVVVVGYFCNGIIKYIDEKSGLLARKSGLVVSQLNEKDINYISTYNRRN